MLPNNLLNGQIRVEAIGAAGQAGAAGSIGNVMTPILLPGTGVDCWYNAGSSVTGGGTPGSGGQAADVVGNVSASPSETLFVEVGGTAFYYRAGVAGSPETIASQPGWNGGSAGGAGTLGGSNTCGGFGGGGGGASDVQTCSMTSQSCLNSYGTANDPRQIVAGGGAGGGGSGSATNSPGFNGGAAGQNGTGDGTSVVQGGAAGVNASGHGSDGTAANSVLAALGGGGGGGGGYAGGGGGSAGSLGGGAGGGGGSNLVPTGGSQSLTSSPAEVVISYSVPHPTDITESGSGTYGGAIFLSATLSSRGTPLSGKTISFRIENNLVCGGAPLPACPVTDSTGTATLTGLQLAAGSYSMSAAYAGDPVYAASAGFGTLTVSKAAQTITFPAITAKTLGALPFAVSPTSSSTLAVTVTSTTTGVCTVLANTVSLVAPGMCSLTASQPGDGNYNAATPVTQSFQVSSKNLVKNGGFESPVLPIGSTRTYNPGQKVGAWSVTAGSIDLTNAYWQNGAGAQSVDMAGLAPGTIGQTITLPYTATYTLKFKYAGNPQGLPVKKKLKVTASAPTWVSPVSISKAFDTTTTTTSSMGWKNGKLTFTGTSGDVVTLTFQDTDTATAYGMTLDGISMTAG